MADYKIDSEQLRSSAGKVGTQSKDIMERIRAVQTEVQNTKSFWTGQANNNYERLMQQWKAAADKVQAALDDTVQALNAAAQDYASTEQQNASRFSG